jgi:hypothetical protein
MADAAQWYSAPAVARMLGISERAVRGRIERGSLSAELTDGKWRIPISALPENENKSGTRGGMPNGTSRGVPDSGGGTGGISEGTDTASLIDARQQAQADAVLQRILAPFIEQLALTNRELGKCVQKEMQRLNRSTVCERYTMRRSQARRILLQTKRHLSPPSAGKPPTTELLATSVWYQLALSDWGNHEPLQ